MDEKKVVAFLRCSASAPLNLALEMANLTDHERMAVDLCGIRGLTYDEAVEAMDNRREVDTIKRWYRSETGAPPEYMMMVWNWEHERIVEKVAGVKTLIDMYNK